MANTSPHTTARVTKRPLEDDDIMHRLNQQRRVRKVVDKASMKLLSVEEQKVFSLDRWFQPKSLRCHYTPKNVALKKEFYYHGLYFIREAYLSISGTGCEDMVELLKDEVAMRALFHFANCLRRMREFSLCMQAIRADLSRKLKIDGTTAEEAGPFAKPEELDRSRKGRCPCCSLIHEQVCLLPSAKTRELERSGNSKPISCSAVHIEGDDRFSIKVYNMLLILNEMLTQMGFKSEDVEGYGHAALTEIVQDRMSRLRIEMVQAETLLVEQIEQINSVYKSECVSTSDELRSKLRLLLRCKIQGFAAVLSSNKEIYAAFKTLIELMDDICRRWHTDNKGRKFPSHEVVMEWRKHIAGTPWTAEKFLNFNWNI